MFRILVVCAANICRSPYAAAVLRSYYRPECVEVESAGVIAVPGDAADAVMAEFAESRGWGDLRAHRSQPALGRVLAAADLVLAMEQAQVQALLRPAPELTGRVRMFAVRPPVDIEDPHGREVNDYLRAVERIEAAAREWVDRLESLGFVAPDARVVGVGRHA